MDTPRGRRRGEGRGRVGRGCGHGEWTEGPDRWKRKVEQADGADKYENCHKVWRGIAGRGKGEGMEWGGRTKRGSGEGERRWGVVRNSGRAQELTRGVEM